MPRFPSIAILCLSALLAVLAAPSTVHIEVDIPGSYVGNVEVIARVGSHLYPSKSTHPERPSVDNTTQSTPALAPVFQGCLDWQQVSIRAAFETAREFIADALAYLREEGTGPRYQRWFGGPDNTRRGMVTARFLLVNSYDIENWTYVCHDPCPVIPEAATVAAYVDDNIVGVVHLCPAWFFETEAFRGRILIHEATHFVYNGHDGTDDEAYKVEDAQWLAEHRPDIAVRNAVNYDFFAGNYGKENDPKNAGAQEVLAGY